MRNQKVILTTLLILFAFTLSFAQKDRDEPKFTKDQVFLDDVIIDGSECVGFDCVNGESFGFDTERLKENNLRIHFQDTSTSASFPSNDWRIKINDTSNGGGNFFAIEDSDAGRDVFKVEAGAPSNALYVDDGGRVGISTSTPVVELHIVNGDTPIVRLEQNGSSGFTTPQTWDVAGNETNFFVRDATNGSTLPFRIRPSANTSSIDIKDNSVEINSDGTDTDTRIEGDTDQTLFYANAGDDRIGVGTDSPIEKLSVNNGNMMVRRDDGTAANIVVLDERANGSSFVRLRNTEGNWLIGQIPTEDFVIRNVTLASSDPFKIDPTTHAITALGDITANGNLLNSDMRLKKNVRAFEVGLSLVSQLNPISYNFNGKAGITETREYYSISAQELQKAAPYLVHDNVFDTRDEDGNIIKSESFLKIDHSAMTWVLVNSVKEQQAQIEDQAQEIADLKTQMEELISLIKDGNNQDIILNGGNNAALGQNFPNPFNDKTVIEYFLPQEAGSAEIQIFDVSGKLIKKETITQAGKGRISVEVKDLPSGQYSYSLIIGGKIT